MFYIKRFITRLVFEQHVKKTLMQKAVVNQIGCRHTHTDATEDPEKIIADICKGDQDLEKKLRILMLEVDVMRQDGRNAPDNMKLDHWQRLLELPSRHQRTKFLMYLFKTEKAKENNRIKKEQKRLEREQSEKVPIVKEYPDDLDYGIGNQSMFMRIRDQSVNAFDNYRAIQSMIFGQNLVMDCSYEDKMVTRETLNAAKQMTYVFGDNRIHKEPFNLHLCNVNINGYFMKQMKKNIPSITEPWFPLNMHETSYLDLFPKKDLVYLTPHCREELTTYDHDAVYIIGCMVDTVNNEPLSLAKAKRDGLKMAKLPLDRYIEWGMGSKKTLNINHMVLILLDMKISGDWKYAFQNVPKRKMFVNQLNTNTSIYQKNRILKDVFNNKFDKRKFKGFTNKSKYEKHLLFDDSERF